MTIKENILKSSYTLDKELYNYNFLAKDNIFYEYEDLDALYDRFILGEEILTESIFDSGKVKKGLKNIKKMTKGRAITDINKLNELVTYLDHDIDKKANSLEMRSMVKKEIEDLTNIIEQLKSNQKAYDSRNNSKEDTKRFIELKKKLIKNFGTIYQKAGKIVYPASKIGKIMRVAKALMLTVALTAGAESTARFIKYEPDVQQGIEKIMGEKPGTRVYTEPVTGQRHVKGEHERALDKETDNIRERGNSAATAAQNATTAQLQRPGGTLDVSQKKLGSDIDQGEVSREVANYVNTLKRSIGTWGSRQPTILQRLEQALANKIDSTYLKDQKMVYHDIDAAIRDIQAIKTEIDKIAVEIERSNINADKDAINELNAVRSDIVKSLKELRDVKKKYFDSQGNFANQADEASAAATQHYQQRIAAARAADEKQSNNAQFFIFRILQRIFKSIPKPDTLIKALDWLKDTMSGNYSVDTNKKKRYLNY
ncbi:MAG: hypothetical protein LBF97_05510 [Elusimicrobiota bacterium]|jgi:hypothetical protein|nr:hypothetical protein [Elusimicrobiota bacterium]